MNIILRDSSSLLSASGGHPVRMIHAIERFANEVERLLTLNISNASVLRSSAYYECMQLWDMISQRSSNDGAIIVMDPALLQFLRDEESAAEYHIFGWPVSRRHKLSLTNPGTICTADFPTNGIVRPETVLNDGEDEYSIYHQLKAVSDIQNLIATGEIRPNVTIIDDDSRTKRVFAPVMQQLPSFVNIQLLTTMSFSRVMTPQFVAASTATAYDVLDVHDFLIGENYSGLAAGSAHEETPNAKLCRVPYLYPFVNLHYSATIDDDHQQQFSIEIVKANIEYRKHMEQSKVSIGQVFAQTTINFFDNIKEIIWPGQKGIDVRTRTVEDTLQALLAHVSL